MKLTMACPECHAAIERVVPGDSDWTCLACGATGVLADGYAKGCAACGNAQMYRKKDFPQWLGMGLLGGACLLFFVFAILYRYTIAWTVLLGSAAVDAIIYLIVGDVVVCYRCGAEHRGLPSRDYNPHELTIAERYRQEELRRAQLRPR